MAELFKDRQDAGKKLAAALSHHSSAHPLILAIPRGGVVVGAVLAEALRGELEVIVPRKIGAPSNPELAIGAVTEDGTTIVDDRLIMYLAVPASHIDIESERQQREVQRRARLYRQGRPRKEALGRTVIVVDDGIATGLTVKAALQSVIGESPRHLILAVPVAPPEALEELAALVDELCCLMTPRHFHAVGQWYRDFAQTDDEQVVRLLEAHSRQRAEPD